MARVFEQSGVWAGGDNRTGWVTLYERGKGVDISVNGFNAVNLSADAARRLARQLHRFAGRVEHATDK